MLSMGGTYSETYPVLRTVANRILTSVTQTLWEKAIQRLTDEDRQLIALEFNSPDPTLDTTELDILRLFVHETEKQKAECERRQWKYTDSSGEQVVVRDRVNTLLVNLNRFTFIGDLVVQPLPSVVSLAWGGFKALLQARFLSSPVVKEKSDEYSPRMLRWRSPTLKTLLLRWRAWIPSLVFWAIAESTRNCMAGEPPELLNLSMLPNPSVMPWSNYMYWSWSICAT